MIFMHAPLFRTDGTLWVKVIVGVICGCVGNPRIDCRGPSHLALMSHLSGDARSVSGLRFEAVLALQKVGRSGGVINQTPFFIS